MARLLHLLHKKGTREGDEKAFCTMIREKKGVRSKLLCSPTQSEERQRGKDVCKDVQLLPGRDARGAELCRQCCCAGASIEAFRPEEALDTRVLCWVCIGSKA